MPNALSRRSTWLAVSTVLILFVAALLPSLNRLDFFDGVEHFNLATVQEMRRNEAAGLHVNWALPELQQDARLVKPPLTAWLAALLITPADTASLSSFKAEDRAQAMSRFVFFARLPTLVCTCLLLVGVFVLARALAQDDPRVGIIAMIVCASSMLMFQQGRRATTDLQLATWVTWTNALIAIAIFQNRKRLGYIAGGVALGLASMAKGPHIALLLTVVPFALMARRIYRAHPGRTPIESAVPRPARRWPLFVGIGLALTIGLGWYGYVAASVDGIGEVWWRELTRHNAQTGRNKMPADPWYTYLWLFAVMLPWTAWLVLGAAWAIWPAPRKANISDQPEKIGATDRYRLPMQIAIALFLLPLLIFSFFSEKKERYLLPFAAPVAVLVALAIVRWWDQRRTRVSKATATSSSLDRKLGWMAGLLTLVGVGWLLYSAPTAPSAFRCAPQHSSDRSASGLWEAAFTMRRLRSRSVVTFSTMAV